MKLPALASSSSATLILLSLIALGTGACRETAPASQAPLQVKTVAAKALTPAFLNAGGSVYLGILRGDVETNLSFKVNGQIQRIGDEGGTEDWREGVQVKKGCILAQIDTANFVNTVKAARARAELARTMHGRNTELFKATNLSQSEFDASLSQRDTAEADLAQAEQNLQDTTLRAPYDGILLARYARSGEYAGAGKPVLRLGDFTKVRLEIGVPETLLAGLSLGQHATISLSAYEAERFDACITEIGNAASEGSRLFKVVLTMDNKEGRLKSGMTATVRLGNRSQVPANGVYVPLSALISPSQKGSKTGGTAVFVVNANGIVHERSVQTGDLIESSIVILDGLKEGEQVVTTGAGQLYNGAQVNGGSKE